MCNDKKLGVPVPCPECGRQIPAAWRKCSWCMGIDLDNYCDDCNDIKANGPVDCSKCSKIFML